MEWYVSKNGSASGPFSLEQIKAQARDGEPTPEPLVWRFGMSAWTPLDRLDELRVFPANSAPVGGARTPNPSRRRSSYLARHWRGELSLPVSFWVNGNAISLALTGAVAAVAVADVVNRAPRLFSAVGATYWLVVGALSLWQSVGIWRSARNHLAAGKSRIWGGLAKAAVALSAIGGLYMLAAIGYPQFVEFSQLALGRDPIGSYELRVLPSGTELEVSGAIVFGLTDEVETLLEAQPKIAVLQLSSPGGRVAEARRLRDLVQARGLATFTATGCASACTLVFAAGERRFIAPAASLGFHQYAFPGVHPSAFSTQYQKDMSDWLARGIDPLFIEHAYATPSDDLWQPTHVELFSSRFVTDYAMAR